MTYNPIHEPSSKRDGKEQAVRRRHSSVPPKHYYTREEVERVLKELKASGREPAADVIQSVLTQMGSRPSIGHGSISRGAQLLLDTILKPALI